MRLTLVALILTVLATPAADAQEQRLRDWVASCTPAACEAFTTTLGRTEPRPYSMTLMLVRGADETDWSVAIRVDDADPAPDTPLILQADDGAAFRLEPKRGYRYDGAGTFSLREAVPELIAAMRAGNQLFITFQDQRFRETGAPFSLKGVIAAMLWIDERQGRAGGANPAAAATPLLLPDKLIAAHFADGTCQPFDEEPLGFIEPERHDLGEGQTLFLVPCSAGAYNMVYRLYVYQQQYDELRQLAFASYSERFGWGGTIDLINVSFNPQTLGLTSFAKGRGLGDCGSAASYRWQEWDFKLLEYRSWERCDGTRMPEQWPVIYSAPR